MRVDPARQAQTLLLAALLGLAAGLVYDLLRPPRRRLRGPAALLPDALFCLLVGAAFFLFAMSAGEGRLGLGALAAAWTGFLAWLRLCSPFVLPVFDRLFQYLDIIPLFLEKKRKKFQKSKKKTFKNGKNAL